MHTGGLWRAYVSWPGERSDWQPSHDYINTTVSLLRVPSWECEVQGHTIVQACRWPILFLKLPSFIWWADVMTVTANVDHCVSYGTSKNWYGHLGASSQREGEFTACLALCCLPLGASAYDLWSGTVLLSCGWSLPRVSCTKEREAGTLAIKAAALTHL